MPEARFHPRLRVHAQADVVGAEVVLWRALEDLSLGGCKLGGPAWEEVGAAVSLVLSFPTLAGGLASLASLPSMPLMGTVVRAGSRDMAIRFHGMSDEQRATLRKHIQDSHEAAAGA
ncbi:MAG: PilZ domain-containing protein [Nannocystis sp.]|nr:PilZ domain-containing protein [Nannocystis sp.]MBA3550416.1 PilZ domain-containing protein [Nannocystis sp.]